MSFESKTVNEATAAWRSDMREHAAQIGIDAGIVETLIASIEPCVRSQIEWMDLTLKQVTINTPEPFHLQVFHDSMLGAAYRDPVYLLEVHCLPGGRFRINGDIVRTDIAENLDDLKAMVRTAFNECVSHVIITRAGVRSRFDCQAEFEQYFAIQ
jgi:hypothetical protein